MLQTASRLFLSAVLSPLHVNDVHMLGWVTGLGVRVGGEWNDVRGGDQVVYRGWDFEDTVVEAWVVQD